MPLLNYFRERKLERKLKQEVVDEILASVYQKDIALSSVNITSYKTSKYWRDIPLESLIKAKRNGESYSLNILIKSPRKNYSYPDAIKYHISMGLSLNQKNELGIGGHFYIHNAVLVGKTINTNYGPDLEKHMEKILELEEEGILIKLPNAVGENQMWERYKENKAKELEKVYQEWEMTSLEEWKKRNNENNSICPTCNGSGSVEDYVGDWTWENKTCLDCTGGKINAQTLKRLKLPMKLEKIEDIIHSLYGDFLRKEVYPKKIERAKQFWREVKSEFERDGRINENFFEPTEYSLVYCQVHSV